jgi:hypothetical protein
LNARAATPTLPRVRTAALLSLVALAPLVAHAQDAASTAPTVTLEVSAAHDAVSAQIEGDASAFVVEITAWPDDDESAARSAVGTDHAALSLIGAWPDAHEIHFLAEVAAADEHGAPHGPVLARAERSWPIPSARHGVLDEPWFWVVLGVIAAGAIAGVVVATLPQPTTLGPPQLVDHLP